MGLVAITSRSLRNGQGYVEAIRQAGGEARLLLPTRREHAQGPLLEGAGGLLLSGGPDVSPGQYGEVADPAASVHTNGSLDSLELRALQEALERNLPVLAICRGMQLLNVAFGGKLLQDVPGHRGARKNGTWSPSYHQVYISPGSKLAAILGMGGFFRVNSQHHQGLRDPQRSPRLLASAYSLEDGLVEGLESPEHDWVIGVQCHPEVADQVPRVFANLFLAFVERAEEGG